MSSTPPAPRPAPETLFSGTPKANPSKFLRRSTFTRTIRNLFPTPRHHLRKQHAHPLSVLSFFLLLTFTFLPSHASAQTLGGACTGSPYSADEISVVKNNIVVCNTSSVWQSLLGAPAADPNYSVALGANSLANLTSGTNNTALGYDTGPTLTTGSSNILIGSGADVPAASTSSFLDIGNLIYGLLSSGYVGIGTTTPATLLSVGSGSPFQVSSTGATSLNTTTAATSSTVGNPPVLTFNGTYWTGSASATETLSSTLTTPRSREKIHQTS